MKIKTTKNNPFEIKKTFVNAIVVYTNGITEQFAAIRKIDKGVIIGRVLNGEFVDCGFIPMKNIKEIRDSIRRK
jgi:hypothetical protein